MIFSTILAAALSILTASARPHIQLTESEVVERGIVIVRLDPKPGAKPGECDDLAASELSITVGRRPAKVSAVERVPRPLRHWLLLDVSESAEGKRAEAMRSAAQYVREVMSPGIDSAAIVAVDEDAILLAGPSSDPAELAREIERIPPGGWSALRDGFDTVLRQIQGDRHEHLVLFWTDGQDQSSVMKNEELYATLQRAPNATVFPIALRSQGSDFPPAPGMTFMEVARRSGGEVFVSSDPRWLDRVRGWIARRFTVGFVPPEPPKEGAPPGGKLEIAVPQKRCQVTLLDDPFARPDPVAGAAPPPPPALVRTLKPPKPAEDLPCESVGEGESPPWEWPLTATRDELSGCMLDVVRSSGPYVRRDGDAKSSYSMQKARVLSRRIRVLASDLARLPSDLAEVIDAVTPNDASSPAPFLMEGSALLGQRSRIATSLFAARADYHAFALQRLKRFAEDELRAIERDLARAFPDMPPEAIAAAARDSRAGRRALEATQTPTDADIVRVLAAWIRDVPAGDLLLDLERRFIDLRIRRGDAAALDTHWSSIRERFATPSKIRVAAPLVLLRDPGQDVIGFARIVLPRPERFVPPEGPPRRGEKPIDARLPLRPLALSLVDALAKDARVAEMLASRPYRAVALSYAPLDPLERSDPARPFVRARIALTLEASRPLEGSAPRVELDADVDGSGATLAILRMNPAVTGDPALAAVLRPVISAGGPNADGAAHP